MLITFNPQFFIPHKETRYLKMLRERGIKNTLFKGDNASNTDDSATSIIARQWDLKPGISCLYGSELGNLTFIRISSFLSCLYGSEPGVSLPGTTSNFLSCRIGSLVLSECVTGATHFRGLFPVEGDNQRAAAAMVAVLAQVDTLPGADVQASVGDRDR